MRTQTAVRDASGQFMNSHRIGVDLGGTKIEGVVLDPEGVELFRKRVPTERDRGYEHILKTLKGLSEELRCVVGSQKFTFGIGTPGTISPKTGLMKNSNTLCMNGRPVRLDLEKWLGHPIAIQNDANCFALAEAKLGVGRGCDLVFGVIMGTGCGGGLVYRGEPLPGLQGIAGEWGHMSIDPLGPLCFCGRRGCVETFISGAGLENRYQERYGTRKPLKLIEKEFYEGNDDAIAFMQEFFSHFGAALSNLIGVLDPDMIVLGGGVSNFNAIYKEGLAEVKKQVFTDELLTPIVKNTLGDSAGVLGAALIGI